jgi:hypothetical protein
MGFGRLYYPLGAAALICGLASCGEGAAPAASSPPTIHTQRQEIRPTQGEGHLGNGYGDAPVRSLASAGGHARVWWAETGADAPPGLDQDTDGVPDFVQEVARVADEVIASLEADGWRLPVRDLTRNEGDFGGDDRFDIYLKQINAGDGYVVAEACAGVTCAGYLVIENDFRGLGYGSWGEAIRVLVSHEFFHAVQNAYYAGVPAWVSEGSATWHEEHLYPEQDDFERLSSYYMGDPKRSLNDRNRGPTDAFAYGAGLFFWSLELAHDAGVARVMLERMAAGASAEDGLDAALVERGDSLAGAFARFSVWNTFTGRRAVTGQGYPQAAALAPLMLQDFGARGAFNWDVDPDPLSAQHGVFQPGGPVSIEAIAARTDAAAPTVAVIDPTEFAASGAYTLVAPGQKVVIDHAGGPLYIVALHDGAAGRRPGRIQIRVATVAPVEPDMPPDMMPDMDATEPDMAPDAPDMEADMEPAIIIEPPTAEDEGGCTSAPAERPAGGAACLLALVGAAWGWRRRGRA